jgi:hypothetical protein
MGSSTIRRAARIGVVVAESGAEKQALLKQFADRRRGEGLRVAGVVEVLAPDAHSDCGALDLLDLAGAWPRQCGADSIFFVVRLDPAEKSIFLFDIID